MNCLLLGLSSLLFGFQLVLFLPLPPFDSRWLRAAVRHICRDTHALSLHANVHPWSLDMSDSKYFTTTKKGEIKELKKELDNPKENVKKEAVKKVGGYCLP